MDAHRYGLRSALGLAALCIALVTLALPGASASAAVPPPPQCPRTQGTADIVFEPSTHEIVCGDNVDVRRPIASATKLMTALLTLERLNLKKTLSAARYPASPLESILGLIPREQMTVADLLRALLLESANDAAVTLARGVSGSDRAFVAEMNKRARELGLKNTHYANPIGLDDPRNFSTAHDLVMLAAHLRHYRFFRQTVRLTTATLVTGHHPRYIQNRNTLLRTHPWVDGVKTGHTSKAGFVLVASGTSRRVTLLSAVLGEQSERARERDTLKLLQWGFGLYKSSRPVARDQEFASVRIRYRRGARLRLIAQHGVDQAVRKGQHPKVTVLGAPREVSGPIKRMQRFGTIVVSVNGVPTAKIPLVAANEVPKASFVQKLKDWTTRPLVLVLSLPALVLLTLLLARVLGRLRPTVRFRAQAGEPNDSHSHA